MRPSPFLWTFLFLVLSSGLAQAEHEGKLQILLLGDSTTEESVPRRHNPAGPHFEDVIRLLLATEKDVPPANVINQGLSGDTIHNLLTNRYDKTVPQLSGVDYVFIRYGLNDLGRREDFVHNFPKDFHELIARLRRDCPQATIVPMTVIPYFAAEQSTQINDLVKAVSEEEKLTLFDIYPRYAVELPPLPLGSDSREGPRMGQAIRPRGHRGSDGQHTRCPLPRPAGLVRGSPSELGGLSRDRR